jgi:uncharacterized protein with HEPN domain
LNRFAWYRNWVKRSQAAHWEKALDFLAHPAMPPSRQDYELVNQIRLHLARIRSYYPVRRIASPMGDVFYPSTFTLDYFLSDRKQIAATKYQSIAIGEAVKKLSPNYLKNLEKHHYFVSTPWGDLKKNRDDLLHRFFTLDDEKLWWAVRRQYPQVRMNLIMACCMVWTVEKHLQKAGQGTVDPFILKDSPEVQARKEKMKDVTLSFLDGPTVLTRGLARVMTHYPDGKTMDMHFFTSPSPPASPPTLPSEQQKKDPALEAQRRTIRALVNLMDALEEGMAFLEGVSQEEFKNSSLNISAMCYQIGLIGSIVKDQLPNEFKTAHPEISWAQISRMRNVVTHAYDEVDFDILWKTGQQHIPALFKQLQTIIQSDPAQLALINAYLQKTGRL